MASTFWRIASYLKILICISGFIGCFFISFTENNPQAAETIIVAAILPQTGKAANYGHSVLEGVEVAIDSINESGGILGKFLELVVIDNKSSPLGSKQAAQNAISINASVVIGAVWSTHSLAMAPVLQKAGIPMISPGSTAPQVTHTGSYIFRACYTDSFQGRLMAGFAYHNLGARTAAILTNLNETYSQELGSHFYTVFQQIGGKVVLSDGYKGTAVDFAQILQPIKAHSPDVVFIPGYASDSGLIIRQARTMSINSIFLGGDAWESIISNYAGPGLEGSYYSTFWNPEVSSPESRRFIKEYYALHGKKEISPYAALAFDAVNLFADAVRRAESLQGEKVQQSLQKTKSFQGVTGTFSFDEFGDPLDKGAAILKFEMGRWIFYKWVDSTAWQTPSKNNAK